MAEHPAAPHRFAVIGHPVSHSLSPVIHQAFGRQCGIVLVYGLLESPVADFERQVGRFFADGGAGLNVTVPFKLRAHALADELDPLALAAGAVNTLARHGSGLMGYNTDGVGLVRDLADHLGCQLAQSRILVLGAGGAVQGVLPSLLAAGPAVLDLCNRTPEKAQTLVQRFGGLARAVSYRQLERAGADGPAYDLIINGTSAGLAGEGPSVPRTLLEGALCYDMVYGRQTPFLQAARLAGARRAVDGLGMLVEQAAEAFRIWHGVLPDTAPVRLTLVQQSPEAS